MDEVSRGLILAASKNLWLGEVQAHGAPGAARNTSESPAPLGTPSIADIKRSLWSRREEDPTIERSPHRAREQHPHRDREGEATAGEEELTLRLEAFSREFKTTVAKLSRAEADLKRQAEEFQALQRQKETAEQDLQKQMTDLKTYAIKTAHQLEEARTELTEESAYFSGKLDEAGLQAQTLTARVQQLTGELEATMATLAETRAELTRKEEGLQVLQKQNVDREQELRNQIEQFKSDLAKVSPDLEQARKQLAEEQGRQAAAVEAAAKKEEALRARIQELENDVTTRSDILARLKEELRKRAEEAARALENPPALQQQDANREQELQNQIGQLKSDLAKVSPELEQARKQLAEEQGRRVAAVEAATKKEEELAGRLRQFEQEVGARSEISARLEAELRQREESLQALQKQNTDREQELQSQITQLKNGLAKISPELLWTRKQLEEEQAHQEELHGKIAELQRQIQVASDDRKVGGQGHEGSDRRVPCGSETPAERSDAVPPPPRPPDVRPSEQPAGPESARGVSPDTPPVAGDYRAYWRLKRRPFESAPDSLFFFESSGHREGIARILFSIQNRKSIAVLTGDYGSGKSVLCQAVIGRLAPDGFKTALITNPRMDALDLRREMAHQFGEDIPATPRWYDVLRPFNDLLDRCHAAGQHCAAIIDEAQVIDPSVLEDLRLLLNHQVAGVSPLTLVFVGQTELNDMLRRIPQLYQRINMKFHIPNLAADEVSGYIRHRLETAGGTIELFDEQAVIEVGRLSQGNPREINAICDVALLISALSGRSRVSVDDVIEAGKERT